MDKKNQQSKSQFGTLTATQDANNDYSSSSKSGAASGTMGTSGSAAGTSSTMGTSGSTAGTSSTMGTSTAGTLTAQYDANNDYGGGGKSGNQSQSGQQKVKTSDKNIK